MAGVRRALIVATDEYTDPKLTSLNAPANDARALAEVLRDESVGCFEVETVLNRPSHEVELAIAEFFGAGKYGDTLLAHFSCHGVKSPTGELYFATTDTNMSDAFKLKVTGVPSALVRDAMEESRASLILCLVDCCYSGAFVKLAKAADSVDLTERLGGKGRAVITASTSLQLALDGEEEPSLFTHAVIDGLRSGEADRDLDGLVSLDELYSFVHEQVTSRNPNQTPVKNFDVQGEVYVARRSTPVTRPAPLDKDLLADARALASYRRLGAVEGLAAVLDERHPGRSLAARMELARMAGNDDSLSVRREAQKVLDAAGEIPTPAIPDYEPTVATRGARGVEDAPATAAEDAPATAVEDAAVTAETLDIGTTDTESTDLKTTQIESDTDVGDGTRRWWHSVWLKRVSVIALGLVGVLVIAGLLSDDDGGTSGDGTGRDLPDTALLVSGNDAQLRKGILAFDVETGETQMVVDNPTASLPTISWDREWMVYMATQEGAAGAVPRLVRVNGDEDVRLLDSATSKTCPFTSRPTFSPDGGYLALNCLDAKGHPVGLGIVNREGHMLGKLFKDDHVRGAPTWTGGGTIVFALDVKGDGTTSLWGISSNCSGSNTPPSPCGKPKPITDGVDGSDSDPDWSNEGGLLFLRTRDGSSNMVYKKSLDDRGVSPISSRGKAESPNWAPESPTGAPGDEVAVVWLEPTTAGDGKTLWLRKFSDKSPTELSTGDYGPPAWGGH